MKAWPVQDAKARFSELLETFPLKAATDYRLLRQSAVTRADCRHGLGT